MVVFKGRGGGYMIEVTKSLVEYVNNLIWKYDGYVDFNREKIYRELEEMGVYDIEVVKGGPVYWSGILYDEPWNEVVEEYGWEEEEIIDEIMACHIVVDRENHELVFVNNEKSKLQFLFDKYTDGYGGNIPANIETIMDRMLDEMEKRIEMNVEKYGYWINE